VSRLEAIKIKPGFACKKSKLCLKNKRRNCVFWGRAPLKMIILHNAYYRCSCSQKGARKKKAKIEGGFLRVGGKTSFFFLLPTSQRPYNIHYVT
jgi:hypothetical protein